MNLRFIFRIFRDVSWLKTIIFNFNYFSISTAIHLPVFIFKNTCLSAVKGKILFKCPIRMGIVRIGIHDLGTIDSKYNRTIWHCNGTVVFSGTASIGSGTRISINRGGSLLVGDKFCITGGSTIICSNKISFGDECLLSWDILIMDTDFHRILNEKNDIVNISKPIFIGNHVWIGCRNLILKGVHIADNVVVAAGSKTTKDVAESYCIVGERDFSKIIKNNVYWEK